MPLAAFADSMPAKQKFFPETGQRVLEREVWFGRESPADLVTKGQTGGNTKEGGFSKLFCIRQIFWGDVLNVGRGTPHTAREFCIGLFKGLAKRSTLREAHVVFFTTSGKICGVFHHKSKSPQVLVVFFTTSPDHHKYLW